MRREHVKHLIATFLSGGLSEAQRRGVQDHLAVCPRCRQAFDKIHAKWARQKREALKKAASESGRNLFLARADRRMPYGTSPRAGRWGRTAAILAAVVLTGWGLWQWSVPDRWSFSKPSSANESEEAERSSAVSPGPAEPMEENKTPPSPASPPENPALSGMVVPSTSSAAGASLAAPPEFIPRQWRGSFSQIKDFRELVIREEAAWKSLWTEMGQPGKAPALDFDRVMVVGVCLGEKPTAGYEVTLGPPHEENAALVVPYRIAVPAPGPAAAVVTHAYHLRTVPRSTKTVQFVQSSGPAAPARSLPGIPEGSTVPAPPNRSLP